jgi:hypothetical protein
MTGGWWRGCGVMVRKLTLTNRGWHSTACSVDSFWCGLRRHRPFVPQGKQECLCYLGLTAGAVFADGFVDEGVELAAG